MSRCVDLDERVTAQFYDEECEEWTMQTCTIEDVLDSVCDEYTVLHSAQPRWIPCSERLPEPDRSVLVQLRVDYADPIQIMTLNISKCEGEFSCLWKTQEMSIYFDMEDVVAWMPLPECYRGENDGQ